MWNKVSGVLEANIANDTEYTDDLTVPIITGFNTWFQFDLRNPKTSDAGQSYTISVAMNGLAIPANATTQVADPSPGAKKFPFAMRKDLSTSAERPQWVKDPTFTVTVDMNSAAPCAENIITLSMKSDVDVQFENCCSNAKTTVTVTGFRGAKKTSTFAVTGSGINDIFNASTAAFDDTTGTLTITMKSNLLKTSDQVLTFTLKNDLEQPETAVPEVQVTANCVAITHNSVSGIIITNPLPASACLSQSSPWPHALNTLTLTLGTGFSSPLLSACKPRVVLTGLSGAEYCTDGSPGTLAGDDAAKFALGRWGDSGLYFNVTADIGTASDSITVSTTIFNPVAAQNAPLAMLQMYYGATQLPGTMMVTTCSTSTLTTAAADYQKTGDSKALKVRSPAFLKRRLPPRIPRSTPRIPSPSPLRSTLICVSLPLCSSTAFSTRFPRPPLC